LTKLKIKYNIKEKNKEWEKRMEKIKKQSRNFIIFIVLIILTFYIILKDQDTSQIIKIIIDSKKEFILIGILAMCIYVICEAINIGRILKTLNEKSNFLKNLKYALIGFFFSAITPAASGGQPMQIYYMHKEKISVANSTLALLINLSCVQIVTISIALISLIFNYKYLNTGLIWLFVIGVTLNLSALILLLISIFTKKMSKTLVNISIKVLKFFKVKNIEEKEKKFLNELEKYQSSSEYIKKNKFVIIKNLITTYIQYILFYSVSYWVYCALGLSENNALEVITMQSILYATVSGIPSPGAVGVSEGGFMAIFANIFPETMLESAMLLNRGINFYLLVVVSAIVVIVNSLIEKKEEKETKENEELVEEKS